jgi:pimeloyl-ACP methyl ester carboxylesterase
MEAARRRPGLRWWVVRIALGLVLGLAVAIAVDVVRLGGVERWFAAHRLPGPYLPIGRTLDVGGSAVYLDCRGGGSPTVILDAGLGTGAAGWGFVLDGSAAISRTCTWDRPGIGGSESIGRHSGLDAAALLRATLDAAGESGPYVVVGHSLGGVYARIFAGSQAADVAGVVLVDPYLPDIHPVEYVDIPADLREAWLAGLDETNRLIEATEQLNWAATATELAGLRLGDLPLELVFVEQRYRWEDAYEPFEAALIAAWEPLVLGLSSNARLTIAVNATHMIQWDRPDLVVDAIRRLVERARAG